MFRKVFLAICLTTFCIGTVAGCAKPASGTKPAAAGDEKTATTGDHPTPQALPSVSE